MNPLTQIKNTQKATQREISLGLSDAASWHARYKVCFLLCTTCVRA